MCSIDKLAQLNRSIADISVTRKAHMYRAWSCLMYNAKQTNIKKNRKRCANACTQTLLMHFANDNHKLIAQVLEQWLSTQRKTSQCDPY